MEFQARANNRRLTRSAGTMETLDGLLLNAGERQGGGATQRWQGGAPGTSQI